MKRPTTNAIPTDAEFEAASKAMDARLSSERAIKRKIVEHCGASDSLHSIWVWLTDRGCHVDLFVVKDADIESDETQAMRSETIKLLSDDNDEGLVISVDVDSHERVKRDFNGNYDQRFR